MSGDYDGQHGEHAHHNHKPTHKTQQQQQKYRSLEVNLSLDIECLQQEYFPDLVFLNT